MLPQRALRSALAILSLPVLSACADNDSSIFVEGVLLAKAPACEVKADPGAVRLLAGLLDVGFRTTYQAILLVGNQLAPRGSKENLRTETMGVELRGAEVRLTDATGRVLDEFSVPAGGFVKPNAAEQPGYGLAHVTLIPSNIGTDLFDELSQAPNEVRTVVANVRVYGTTLGGIDVTSGEFSYKIGVCYGCTVSYPPDAMEGGLCQVLADAPKPTQCFVGQDNSIDCRNCSSYSFCLQPPQ